MIAALNGKSVFLGESLGLGTMSLESSSERGTRPVGSLNGQDEVSGGQRSQSPQRQGPVRGCVRSVVYTSAGTADFRVGN